MSVAGLNTRLAQAVLSTTQGFGEAVTLPDASTAVGIFDPQGLPPAGVGSEVGVQMRLSQQPNPTLRVTDVVAAQLAQGDLVQIRGSGYYVARIDADGAGMSVCELMPEAIPSDDAAARWR